MSSVIQHQSVDAVVLGLGVMGGDVAVKLTTAGIKTVGIEKGPYWDFAVDFQTTKYDEWGIMIGRKFDHPLSLSTFTFRNNSGQFALPIRRYAIGQSHAAGHGVGGAAQHYGGQMGRYGPWVYQMLSQTVSRYGAAFLDAAVPNHDIEDWPMTYNDYVPYYKDWEKAYGITGTNQQPFHPDSQFVLPPHPDTVIGAMYRDATQAMGFHPTPIPTSLASIPYVNQYGVVINACVYDGWCSSSGCNYVCETGAKGTSSNRTIPAAVKTGNMDMRLNSYVFRLDTDPTTKKVTAARYYDAQGNVHVQPGKVFFNGLWGFNIIRLMANSAIGDPYNPTTVTGSLGRSPAASTGNPSRSSTGTLAIGANAYPAGNGTGGGYTILDLADDNFDHTGLNFIGGAYGAVGNYVGAPGNMALASTAAPANIGGTFKGTLKDRYLPTTTSLSLSGGGMVPPTNENFVDLDPVYTDVYGDPLARITIDYPANSSNASNYIAPKLAEILARMGATNITTAAAVVPRSAHPTSWSAHTRGGARIGANAATSVFNRWQQCWTIENLFAAGEITKPTGDNTTTGGTHPAGTTSLVAADGIKKYLQSSGPLV